MLMLKAIAKEDKFLKVAFIILLLTIIRIFPSSIAV